MTFVINFFFFFFEGVPKRQIKANINILSACSLVFKDILKKERNSSAIMYLRGIKYSEMESIIQFIHLGEAIIHEERMDEFLSVAKSLGIKVLSKSESEANEETKVISKSMGEHPVISDEKLVKVTQESRGDGTVHECDQNKTFSNRRTFNCHKKSVHEGKRYSCNKCAYQTTHNSHLTVHIQSKHEGIQYACDQCDYQASCKSDLNKHFQQKH